jgi:predicted transcriptional regulator
MGFTHTTHEPCLYYKHHVTLGLLLLLQQGDDFIIGAKTMELCLDIKQQIQDNMVKVLNELGVIKRFNGLDIEQTGQFIKISAQTYINKIVEHHGWQLEKTANLPLPMRKDSTI